MDILFSIHLHVSVNFHTLVKVITGALETPNNNFHYKLIQIFS